MNADHPTSWNRYLQWLSGVRATPTVDLTVTAGRSVRRLTGYGPDELSTELADLWWTALAGRAPQTRVSYLGRLRAFYRWRYQRNEQPDPTRFLVRPRIPSRRPRPVPLADVHILLAHVDQPVLTWVGLAYYAGLRRGEISRLGPRDVGTDFSGRPVLHVLGKGNKPRVVPLRPELAQLLAGYAWPETPSAAAVGQRVKAAMRGLDIAGSLHSIRHTYASHAYETCGDIAAVSELLGHSSLTTTQVYARADLTHLHRVVSGMYGSPSAA